MPQVAYAAPPWSEVDSDVALRGAIFASDVTGLYASYENGQIHITSDGTGEHIRNIKFKGTAITNRLKNYNGFIVGVTHIADDGTISHYVDSLEIDDQGFAYATYEFSETIISGLTGTTTFSETGLSGNYTKSFNEVNVSYIDFNITNHVSGLWTAEIDSDGNTSTFENRTAYTINHSGALSEYQIKLDNNVTDSDRWTYENGTHIPHWNESLVDDWINASLGDGNTTIYKFDGNVGLSSNSSGPDTFDFYDYFDGDLNNWTTVQGAWEISGGRLHATSTGVPDRIKSPVLIDEFVFEGEFQFNSLSGGLVPEMVYDDRVDNIGIYIAGGTTAYNLVVDQATISNQVWDKDTN
ncbi:MAG: hypothetical protein KAJ03_10015, partial [Gammaproteobacteria bacterium]|nr:hypothetical protein [Gammaproteobacteria bacterium]